MSVTVKNLPFDSARAEAFAGQLLAALNNGALCLMASIGHRTGLFDIMCGLPPSTSAEIADKAGLRQMYHLVNHSTYHRGQVAAMLRQLGLRPIATDFLVFHDEMESGPPLEEHFEL